ncbi:hypothetical protein SVIO_058420 [Streptomyces violaceusniger]|uniref:Uncharacterized protein n=1 Tax=Streptomyces violaceusniger TaxID=68280 RepID=A0A4D4LB44_STRVO|nr:hypothetical protein SVIO_058420 [Streptomyces violaceusniger]
MHHPGPVDVAQRLDQPEAERPQLPPVQGAVPPYDLGEGSPRYVQGGHPRPVGLRVGVHDGGGERPAHPARRHDLLPEAGAELLVLGVLLMDQLDRDLSPRGRAPEIDDPHAARAEPVEQGVAAYGFRIPGGQRHRRSPLPRLSRAAFFASRTALPET